MIAGKFKMGIFEAGRLPRYCEAILRGVPVRLWRAIIQ